MPPRWRVKSVTTSVLEYIVHKACVYQTSVAYRRGFKPPEIPKALQNRAELNPNVKNVKNYWI